MADETGMRENYIEWNDYFMAQARLAAQRSKDPDCQVGATIVTKSNVIVGTGYNTMPKGKDWAFTWKKYDHNEMLNKHSFVCHAELNAIVNAKHKNVTGCIMYVSRIPCKECAKLIIQSGIQKVYYISKVEYDEKAKISKEMFRRCEVPLIPWKPIKHKIEFNLTDVETQTE